MVVACAMMPMMRFCVFEVLRLVGVLVSSSTERRVRRPRALARAIARRRRIFFKHTPRRHPRPRLFAPDFLSRDLSLYSRYPKLHVIVLERHVVVDWLAHRLPRRARRRSSQQPSATDAHTIARHRQRARNAHRDYHRRARHRHARPPPPARRLVRPHLSPTPSRARPLSSSSRARDRPPLARVEPNERTRSIHAHARARSIHTATRDALPRFRAHAFISCIHTRSHPIPRWVGRSRRSVRVSDDSVDIFIVGDNPRSSTHSNARERHRAIFFLLGENQVRNRRGRGMESHSTGVRDTIGHSVRTRSRPPARGGPHSSTRREQCPLSSLPPSSAASPPSRRPRSKYVFS